MLITNMLHRPLKVAVTMVNMSMNSFTRYYAYRIYL